VRKTVGIFKEIYEGRELLAAHEYRELRRMLLESIERGLVEQVREYGSVGPKTRYGTETKRQVKYML